MGRSAGNQPIDGPSSQLARLETDLVFLTGGVSRLRRPLSENCPRRLHAAKLFDAGDLLIFVLLKTATSSYICRLLLLQKYHAEPFFHSLFFLMAAVFTKR